MLRGRQACLRSGSSWVHLRGLWAAKPNLFVRSKLKIVLGGFEFQKFTGGWICVARATDADADVDIRKNLKEVINISEGKTFPFYFQCQLAELLLSWVGCCWSQAEPQSRWSGWPMKRLLVVEFKPSKQKVVSSDPLGTLTYSSCPNEAPSAVDGATYPGW